MTSQIRAKKRDGFFLDAGRRRSSATAAALVVITSLFAGPASGQVQIDAQASIARNDNINLDIESGNEFEETIQRISTRFVYSGASRFTTTNLVGNLFYTRYADGFFDNDVAGGAIFDFDATSGDGRFSWTVSDDYGQQTIDPVALASPDNRRDTNIFRTGPSANFQLGSRNTLRMSAINTLNTFEDSSIDNSRLTGAVEFTRQLGSIFSASIGANYEATEFDELEGFDFDNQNASLTIAATGRRNTLSVTLGKNEIEGDFGETDGLLYGVRYNRSVGANSNIDFQLTRGFSDAGGLFRLTQRSTINVASAQDIVATPDPLENTLGLLTYSRTGLSSSMAVQAFWRKDEFETQTQFDRNEFGVRVFVRQAIGDKWEVLLNGGSVRRDLQGLRQEDDTHIWSIQLMRDLGRRFGAGLRFDRIFRTQNRDGFDRESNQVMLFVNFRRQRQAGTASGSQQIF